MRLFSYKLTHDTGFAPNPFFGTLTLATCKPEIRRTKQVGDWIAGFTSNSLCGDKVGEERLIYLMKVTAVLSIEDYFQAKQYADKIPKRLTTDPKYRLGDNIYQPNKKHPLDTDDFNQIPNDSHGPGNKRHDLSGRNVLISDHFYYFGRDAVVIPHEFRPAIPKGQSGYGVQTHSQTEVGRFIQYIEDSYKGGRRGLPHAWDETCRTRSCPPRTNKGPLHSTRKCGS